MINNFAPQPYPLECSADGETWALVIGWRQPSSSMALEPLLASPDSDLTWSGDGAGLRYRLPATGPRRRPETAPEPITRRASAKKRGPQSE